MNKKEDSFWGTQLTVTIKKSDFFLARYFVARRPHRILLKIYFTASSVSLSHPTLFFHLKCFFFRFLHASTSIHSYFGVSFGYIYFFFEQLGDSTLVLYIKLQNWQYFYIVTVTEKLPQPNDNIKI